MKSENLDGLSTLANEQMEFLGLSPDPRILLLHVSKLDSISKKLLVKLKASPAYKILLLPAHFTEAEKKQFFHFINEVEFNVFYLWPAQARKVRAEIQQVLSQDPFPAQAMASAKGAAPDDNGQTDKIKSLVRFVKELSTVTRVEEAMQFLFRDIQSFKRVKGPILAFANSQNKFQVVFLQGSDVVTKPVRTVWSQMTQLRWNDVSDSQYLADIFGRPFAKLLSIPLNLRRKSFEHPLQVSAVLFFEHNLNENQMHEFVTFTQERLQPLSIALDRLLLEQDLIESSFLWEKTFDGIEDPVAIFDMEGNILRANKSFGEQLRDAAPESLQSENLRHNNRFYEVQSYPINLGMSTRPSNIIVHYVDVTTAQRLQQQMIQNEKMVALGHLAGNIAHELNNPLTGIRSLAQILEKQVARDTNVHNDLVEVERAAERCQQIIKNLQEFSTGGYTQKQERISLNAIVNRTLPLLKTLIRHYNTEIELTESDCDVYVEPHLMQQVVFNIIKNASQAMGDKGQLKIKTEISSDENSAVLRISDTGPGIPQDIKEQIFDFFFTTKTPGQGTGLGLSMSKSILDRFGGKISVDSHLGHGAEFVVQLPKAAAK